MLSASLGHAKDYCFNSTSPPNPAPPDDPDILIVAQKFSLPGKGKCKSVTGFEVASINSGMPQVIRPATGEVCLNRDGDLLRAAFYLHEVYNTRVGTSGSIYRGIQVGMDIPYPALSGGSILFRLGDTDSGTVRTDVFVGPCVYPLSF